MAKKKEDKKSLKRNIAKEERNRKKDKKNKGKEKDKKKKDKKIKNKNEKEYNSDEEEDNNDEDSFEEFTRPGQRYATPPAGDATRAFYESLLEQRPDSIMAKKYCVDYGCLETNKASELLKELEKMKKKKK